MHRQILDNPITQKPEYAWLWIVLLLLTNHKDTEFIWNNQKITLKKGQLLTGRFELSKKTGIASGTVYRILKYLENEQQIEQQKTNKFTIITIINWCRYQQVEQQIEQPVNNRLTTNEQQMNTYNNDNNENNENKRESEEDKLKLGDLLSLNSFYLEKYKNKYKTLTEEEIIKESEKAYHWCKANGKTKKDYNSFLMNWFDKTVSYKELQKNKSSNNYPVRRKGSI